MTFQYSDGGRQAAGFKGTAGDCACRAIAIATDRPYREVYKLINRYAKDERLGKNHRGWSSARTGVHSHTMRKIMSDLGWEWIPTMKIGQGCKIHLRAEELPSGRLILSLSRHWCAVVDGVVMDNHDPRRGGTRCVYGYWRKVQ